MQPLDAMGPTMALMSPELFSSLEPLQQDTTLLPQASLASLGLSGAVRTSRTGEAAARTARERMAMTLFILMIWWVLRSESWLFRWWIGSELEKCGC
jgi:hypothetical protein